MGKFSTRDIVITVTAPSKSKVWKDLHMKGQVTKTLAGTPNTSEMTIFNLNKESRDFLTSIYDDDKSQFTIKLELDNKVFFDGDIVNARSVFNQGTWETSIYANEGYNAYRKTAKIESKKNDTRENILNDMFDSLKDAGINEFDIQALKNGCGNKSILKRVLYDGNVVENIKKLIKDCLPDADTTIDQGKITILPKNSIIEKNTELTQFLEPPQLNEQGCRAKVLINSDIKIGGTVNLVAKSYNQAFGNLTTNRAQKSRFSGEGTYKVIEIQHTFDNFSADVAQTDVTGVFLR